MDFLFRFLVIPVLAIPLLAWYIVMLHVRNEEYPHWLKRVFGLKRVGRILETIILALVGLVVLAMIIFFQLPNNP